MFTLLARSILGIFGFNNWGSEGVTEVKYLRLVQSRKIGPICLQLAAEDCGVGFEGGPGEPEMVAVNDWGQLFACE